MLRYIGDQTMISLSPQTSGSQESRPQQPTGWQGLPAADVVLWEICVHRLAQRIAEHCLYELFDWLLQAAPFGVRHEVIFSLPKQFPNACATATR